MNRLDDVLGPENWWDDYTPSENSVLCRLTIRLPDGQELSKCDAGGYARMADSGDDDKSGYSDAFKRAAVKFGVARYLYRDGVPRFAEQRAPEPAHAAAGKPRVEWPGKGPGTATRESQYGNLPTSGKGLFRWCKQIEEKRDLQVLRPLNKWARVEEMPPRMIDWDQEMVAKATAVVLGWIERAEQPEDD
jgi:hypothetical protein